MLSILIILILAYSFYMGYRRGLVMQAIQALGYLITFLLATRFYEDIAGSIELLVPFASVQQNSNLVFYSERQSFMLDQAFYQAITFVAIFLIGWLLTKFISLFFRRISYYPILGKDNQIVGGLLNLCFSFIFVFILLFILSLIPIEIIQQLFVDNPLAFRIVSDTPILSDWAVQTWLTINPL